MKKVALCFGLIALLLAGSAMAATEEDKDLAIANGLAWLAATQTISGAEGYWSFPNNGTLAATASAALAFVEEGHYPGSGTAHEAVATRAITYVFNRATVDGRFGVETAVYERYAEDYSNDGPPYDEGNDEAIYFEPGAANRRVYTTGIVTPVVYALGESLGTDTVVGIGSAAISGKTYAQAMQDIVDWFSWAQVEPDRGNHRGGWRYDANNLTSDNSTAQWGSLPLLYAAAWGLGAPQYVFDELELWVNYIQNANGCSGYDSPGNIVNVAKTGGLLLELAAIGTAPSDTRVLDAVDCINARWNNVANGTWYGNLNHPYAMWAVFKGLQVYDYWDLFDCGPVSILVGEGIPNAPGGFDICFDASPSTSLAGDWYSHYCDYLVSIQNGDGSWNGYSYWTGPLATAWYINILRATRVPPPVIDVFVDIKPGSCPNPLNTNSKGVLPVAILGTDEFDVMSIDPSTVLLEGVAPIRYNYEDVATPFEGELCDCHELRGDGYLDMTLKFKTQDIVAVLEAMNHDAVVPAMEYVNVGPDGQDMALVVGPREYVRLTLTGQTYEGRDIEGQDCVRVMWKTRGGPLEDPNAEDVPGEAQGRPISDVTLGVSYRGSFGSGASITLALPEPTHVTLGVYDAAGRKVSTLVNESMPAGIHSVGWNCKSDSGMRVARGVYFIKLNAMGVDRTTKMLIVE